jgi:hypothetical protein
MYTDDIYSRLLAGENADDIAAEMAKALNDAQAKKAEEDAKRAMEEAAKSAKAVSKREAMVDLVNDALYFCAEFYPSLGLTVEEVDAMDDVTIYAMADMFIGLLDLQTIKPKCKTKLNVDLKLKNDNTDIFEDFFKSLGL